MARIRNSLTCATHTFFNKEGFLYVHTPIVSTSDCEGVGEMFQVTTLLSEVEREKVIRVIVTIVRACWVTKAIAILGLVCGCCFIREEFSVFASHLECVFYEETFTDTSGQREEMKNGVKHDVTVGSFILVGTGEVGFCKFVSRFNF